MKLTRHALIQRLAAALSPDGRKVAYLPDVQGARSVVVHTLSTAQERNLPPAPRYQHLCLR